MLRVTVLMAMAWGLAGEPAPMELRGRVTDSTGAAVAGARITVAPSSRGVLTGSAGEYSLLLAPGTYTVQVTKDGFAPLSARAELAAGGSVDKDIVLQVAPLVGMITVTESAGYLTERTSTATKTLTPLRDVPQSITVVTQTQMRDQLMMSVADVVRYVPGITAVQGESNRDQLVIRGNNTTADFFVNGVRDDVQYFRDLYNLERVEALKGPNEIGRASCRERVCMLV